MQLWLVVTRVVVDWACGSSSRSTPCSEVGLLSAGNQSSVGGSVGQDGATDEPVLRLHEGVGHPVVLVRLSVAEGLNADLVSDAAASNGGTTEHEHLHSSELSAAEVTGHTGTHGEHGSNSSSSHTHGESEVGPATLSTEEVFLVEEEAVGRGNNLIGRIVRGVVVVPAAHVGTVEPSLAGPHGTS